MEEISTIQFLFEVKRQHRSEKKFPIDLSTEETDTRKGMHDNQRQVISSKWTEFVFSLFVDFPIDSMAETPEHVKKRRNFCSWRKARNWYWIFDCVFAVVRKFSIGNSHSRRFFFLWRWIFFHFAFHLDLSRQRQTRRIRCEILFFSTICVHSISLTRLFRSRMNFHCRVDQRKRHFSFSTSHRSPTDDSDEEEETRAFQWWEHTQTHTSNVQILFGHNRHRQCSPTFILTDKKRCAENETSTNLKLTTVELGNRRRQ